MFSLLIPRTANWRVWLCLAVWSSKLGGTAKDCREWTNCMFQIAWNCHWNLFSNLFLLTLWLRTWLVTQVSLTSSHCQMCIMQIVLWAGVGNFAGEWEGIFSETNCWKCLRDHWAASRYRQQFVTTWAWYALFQVSSLHVWQWVHALFLRSMISWGWGYHVSKCKCS